MLIQITPRAPACMPRSSGTSISREVSSSIWAAVSSFILHKITDTIVFCSVTDPDSNQREKPDPDPQKSVADPQDWFFCFESRNYIREDIIYMVKIEVPL
jgi:hypothetical protein